MLAGGENYVRVVGVPDLGDAMVAAKKRGEQGSTIIYTLTALGIIKVAREMFSKLVP